MSKKLTQIQRHIDPTLEKEIRDEVKALKELARRNGQHFAKNNQPELTGSGLDHYIGEFRSRCEKLGSEINEKLQPDRHREDAKTEADHFRDKDKVLDVEIQKKEDVVRHDEYDLAGYHPGSLPLRIWLVVLFSLIITAGEVIFNTKALQVIGETVLFALIIAITISFAVFIFSHMAPMLYKVQPTPRRRRIVVFSTLTIMLIVFIGLAIYRTMYLASHDVNVSPVFFVVINMFFFIASTLLSFFVLPTWEEIKENFRSLSIFNKVKKLKKEIIGLKKQKEEIRSEVLERTTERIAIIHYCNYLQDSVRKLFRELVEIFKATNLASRGDKQIPECFSDNISDPDLEEFIIPIITDTKR